MPLLYWNSWRWKVYIFFKYLSLVGSPLCKMFQSLPSSINCTKYLMQEYAFSFLISVSFITIYLFLTHHNGRIFRFVSIHLLIALFTCQNEKNRVCQSYQLICATFPPPNWHPICPKRSKCFRFWRIHVAFRKRELIFGAGHAALTAHNRT